LIWHCSLCHYWQSQFHICNIPDIAVKVRMEFNKERQLQYPRPARQDYRCQRWRRWRWQPHYTLSEGNSSNVGGKRGTAPQSGNSASRGGWPRQNLNYTYISGSDYEFCDIRHIL
jgi:hypothetical protein